MTNRGSFVQNSRDVVESVYGYLDTSAPFSNLFELYGVKPKVEGEECHDVVAVASSLVPESLQIMRPDSQAILYMVIMVLDRSRIEFSPLYFLQLYGWEKNDLPFEERRMVYRLMRAVEHEIQPETTVAEPLLVRPKWVEPLTERMPLGKLEMPAEWDWKTEMANIVIPPKVPDEPVMIAGLEFRGYSYMEGQIVALLDGREVPVPDWPVFFKVTQDGHEEYGPKSIYDNIAPFRLVPLKMVPVENIEEARLPPA